MKNLVVLMVLSACTQKYADYDLIRKVDFNQKSYERPVPVTQVMANGSDRLEACFNQWLFFSNAEKLKNDAIPMVVRSLCPGQDYLVNSKMVETWWTSILLTRSCVEVETLCGDLRRKK
jgi:hypothetical protein